MKLKSWLAPGLRLKWQGIALVVAVAGISDRALGQITPDSTLGAETSIVIPNVSTGGIPSDRIEGGAIRGINLFHSFEEFNIEAGRGAYFNNPNGIENILSRVTGSNPSNVFGRLGVQGNANLFLVNSNGIIFGANATLDTVGSFVATTANTIQFGNQGFFNITSDIAPVLTINPTAFLFNQLAPGAIINQSQSGLQVLNGKSLLLVGGEVSLDGGILQAPGGRIEVAGVADEGMVGLDVDGKTLSLTFPTDVARTDISLSNGAVINASGSSLGGKIQIQGRDISLTEGAVIAASGAGGGNIQVQGRRITVSDGSQIVAITQGSKAGGTLTINASELVQVVGTSADGQLSSSLSTQVNPPSNQDATGTGGSLTLNTERLIVQNGAQVSTGTFSSGQGGTLTINASESIELSGTAILENGTEASSGLFTQTNGAGAAGDLTVNTLALVVQDGAQVSASTHRNGQGGRLNINALDSVELSGTSTASLIPSGLFATTEGSGNSGTLSIETGQLVIRDGAVATTSTLGAGNGGSLTVTASESIELSGTTANGEFPSGIFVGTTGSGTAGDLSINTLDLTVQDSAVISVRSLGSGQAGELLVTANSIELSNQGSLSATTLSGNGGDITLQVQDLLLMRDRSTISTSAGTAQAGGDGGNIKIDANFIVAVPSEDSDISANAYTGRGGNIQITTQNLFGIQFRPQVTPKSDISASSTFGINGTVEINTPEVDPSRGLTTLPTDLVNTSSQIAQNCRTSSGQIPRNEFIITGRGGLPDNPSEALSSDTVWTDLRPTTRTTLTQASTQDVVPNANSTSKPLVEAQGWVINDKGNVVLMAQSVPVLPHSPWQPAAECPLP